MSQWKTPGFSAIFKDEYLKNCASCGILNCSLKCGKCGTFYCSKECQRKAWSVHKRICNSLDRLVEFCTSERFDNYNFSFSKLQYEIYGTSEAQIDLVIDDIRGDQLQIVIDEGQSFIAVGNKGLSAPLISSKVLRETGGLKYNLLHTGCLMVNIVPLLILLNPEVTINGEVVAMLALTLWSRRLDQIHRIFGYTSICLSLDPETQNLGKYGADIVPVNLVDLIKANKRERAAIYLVELHPATKKSKAPDIESDKLDQFWKESTRQKMGTNHHLAIIILNGEACILQSYYGHYSYKEWLAFDQDLKLAKVPEPAAQGWHHQLLPNPKFRGKLDRKRLIELAEAISSLATPGDHIETFADITGIINTKETIDRSYFIGIIRVDLDRQLL